MQLIAFDDFHRRSQYLPHQNRTIWINGLPNAALARSVQPRSRKYAGKSNIRTAKMNAISSRVGENG
jgi:hypothetical protein